MSSDFCPYCNARLEIQKVAFGLTGASIIRTCPNCAVLSAETPGGWPQSIVAERRAGEVGGGRPDAAAPSASISTGAGRRTSDVSRPEPPASH